MTRRTCAGCKRPWPPTWPACEACGCPAYVATLEPDAGELDHEERRPAPRPVALDDVPPPPVRFLPTGDPAVDTALGGGLATCGAYLLTGGPGAGKTTLALQMLARYGGTLLECEMPAGWVRGLCEKAGIPTAGIRVFVPETAEDVYTIAGKARGLLVLDSLGRIPARPDLVSALDALLGVTSPARITGKLCLLVIAQQTKAGRARGSLELEHDVDGVIELERDEVRVTKHRFGASETHARTGLILPLTSSEMRRSR